MLYVCEASLASKKGSFWAELRLFARRTLITAGLLRVKRGFKDSTLGVGYSRIWVWF